MTQPWSLSWRADPAARPVADRHYNRQKIGSPQFVPPGRCAVFYTGEALWVTSWPFPEYVKHAWPGAWINSTFRREGGPQASGLILAAVAATRWALGEPPAQGMVSFVDPRYVPPVRRRGKDLYGYCYLKAGFEHVGFTSDLGLWVWQLRPERMPPALAPLGTQRDLLEAV